MSLYHIGEWITAKDAEGRILKGFIEAFDNMDNTAQIFVVESERESDHGQTRWVKQHTLNILPMTKPHEMEGHVLNMIDLALVTNDRTLFHVYADRLRELRGKSHKTRV